MKRSCADFTWREVPHAAVLDLIAALGFDGVDVGLVPDYTALDPREVRRRPEYWAGVLAERAGSRGLAVVDVFPIWSEDLVTGALNHPDPAQRATGAEFFDDMLRFVGAVGAAGMTVSPGMIFDGEEQPTALARAVPALRALVERAGTAGVPVAIEAHVASVVRTPAQVLELLDAVPGLGLTLDYGHFVQQGIAQAEVDVLVPHARHVHCRGGAPGLVQTRLVDSVLDFGLVLDRLLAGGYDAWVAVEYVHDERPGAATCDVTSEVVGYRDLIDEKLRATVR